MHALSSWVICLQACQNTWRVLECRARVNAFMLSMYVYCTKSCVSIAYSQENNILFMKWNAAFVNYISCNNWWDLRQVSISLCFLGFQWMVVSWQVIWIHRCVLRIHVFILWIHIPGTGVGPSGLVHRVLNLFRSTAMKGWHHSWAY